MTTEETRALIAEARFYVSAGHVEAYSEDVLVLLRRLADALEAATRERDAVPDAAGVDAVLSRLDELNNGGISYEVYSELHDLVSAIPTAVPDAATEALVRRQQRYIEELESVDGVGLRAERDAALAAIERVRAIHRNAGPSQGYDSRFKGGYGMLGDCCGECGSYGEYGVEWPCPTIRAIEAALGGEGDD